MNLRLPMSDYQRIIAAIAALPTPSGKPLSLAMECLYAYALDIAPSEVDELIRVIAHMKKRPNLKTWETVVGSQHRASRSDFLMAYQIVRVAHSKGKCPQCRSETKYRPMPLRPGRGAWICRACRYDGGEFPMIEEKYLIDSGYP